MSVKVNTIASNVTFSTTPTTVTQVSTDNSTLGATTSFVQTLMATLVPISISNTITNTLTFTSTIITNLVAGTGPLSLTGNTISLGKLGGTVSFLGVTPTTATYPYTVSSGTANGAKMQSGAHTTANTIITYPTAYSTGSIVIACPSTNTTGGVQSPSAAGVRLVAAASTSMKWISFGI